MPKSNQALIHIVTKPDEELEFYVKDTLRGKELFDLVCRAIGLRESCYFGLYYQKTSCPPCWLRMDKKLRTELQDDINIVKLYLRVEFYPEDVEEGLVLRLTQHLFFLHVKSEILNENVYCPAEEAVLMAAFAIQAAYGDFDDDVHTKIFESKEQLLPRRVTNMYQLTEEQWEERIVALYADHCYGLSRAEAEIEYLKIAQDLEMYGAWYYKIQNANGTKLWMGILATGINIYELDNQLLPKVSFLWSEIKNINFKNTQISIQPMEKEVQVFHFYSVDVNINREILLLCSGNHELYMKRRRPDSLEVQVMKSQANELFQERQREKARFEREKNMRIDANEARLEMEQKLEEYQENLEKYRAHLEKSEEMTDLLAEKALIAEEEARLLLKKAAELESQVKQQRLTLTKKDEEKVYLENHIQNADVTIQKILQDSELRTRETLLLKKELDRSRETEKVATEKLMQVTTARQTVPYELNMDTVAKVTSHDESPPINNAKLLEKERVEYLERSQHLQQQLTELRTEIEGLKVTGSHDMLDRLHLENIGKGENKYSTMQKLQASSTNSRVQVYQGL